MRIRRSVPADGARLVAIWGAAVDATHDFLTPADREAIGEEVRGFLPGAAALVVVDDADQPLGFMVVDGAHVEALFVDPAHHGAGIGRALMAHAMAAHPAVSVDVNEQNAGAAAFYTRLGFVTAGRTAHDAQGRPYPILHLRRAG